MTNFVEIHLPLPQQTLNTHSLFELNRDSVSRWLRSLPGANLGESTRQLYKALVELNKVKCGAKDRLQILEQLRHHVHISNRGLEKHFLNQPVILPEKARKVAQLADTLNKQMAIGYTLTANQFLGMNRLRRPKDLLAMAFHRSITEHSLVLLRNFQLYRDEEPGFWKTIHELFYQALKHKIAREKVADDVWGGNTLEQCYLRPMLLFTARPHQMRQSHQADVFAQLGTWAQKAKVRSDHLQDCVFLFNPTSDAPPTYRELCDDTSGWLGIDAGPLCKMLEDKLASATAGQRDGNELSLSLLSHLHTSWSTMLQRGSVRLERDDELMLSLGLLSTHFYVAGNIPFSEFIKREQKAPLEMVDLNADYSLRTRVDPSRDVWSEASKHDTRDGESQNYHPELESMHSIDYESATDNQTPQTTKNFRYYRTQMVNSSERGYCVQWPTSEAVKLNTGDVIGIREAGDPNWSVGVIRWVKHIDQDENQLGLEVLASVADAYSARLVRAGLAVGEHQRALMLPPDRDSGLVQRILLQKSVFNEGDTVELIRPGQTYRIKLRGCLAQTATVGIFEFSTMVKTDIAGDTAGSSELSPSGDSETTSDPEPNKKKQEFDNLWNDL